VNPGELSSLKLFNPQPRCSDQRGQDHARWLRPVGVVQRRGHDDSVITITTPRLVPRRWHEDDALPMTASNADPEVMRWIDDGTVYNVQQTTAAIEAWEQGWDRHGFGLFALEVRTTGELAGYARLSGPEDMPRVRSADQAASVTKPLGMSTRRMARRQLSC
jgi:RimJ/RimL family protein N-acetyltransferase